MLDAYIIEQIRRQKRDDTRQGEFIPLRIEVPHEPKPRDRDREPEEEGPERGSVIIDFAC